MSLSLFAVGEAALCAPPAEKVTGPTKPPKSRQIIARADLRMLPEAR